MSQRATPGLVSDQVAGWVRSYWTSAYSGDDGRYAHDNGYEGGTRNVTEEYQKQDRWEWLSQRLHSLKDTLYTAQNTISEAQSKQKSAADKMQALNSESQSNQRDISWKQSQLNQVRTELAGLERTQGNLEERIDGLRHQVRSLEGQISMYEDDLERMNYALEQKEREKVRQRDWDPNETWDTYEEWGLNDQRNERDQFKRWYIEEPRRKAHAAEEEMSNLKRQTPSDWQRSQLVSQIANLERELESLQARQEKIQTEYEEAKAEHYRLGQKIWDLQNQYQTAYSEFGTREQEVKALGFTYW